MKRRLLIALAAMLPLAGFITVNVPRPAKAAASASFYASPSSGSYNVGDVIRVSIMINSGGQAINAGEATVTWSGGLQYSFASTSGSIFNTWTSGGGAGPVGSASSVYFAGGLSNPGYNGSGGRVVTVIFNATQPGNFNVNVAGSQILANDGMGTNVLCCSSGASFSVIAKAPPPPRLTVVSKTHPNPGQWYSSHDVNVNWYSTTAVGNYSFSFDHSSGGNPSSPNNATIQTSKTLDDGLWYFHLKGTNSVGSATVHFPIRIDSKAPDNFNVDVEKAATSPSPKVTFSANDSPSGVARYTASIDGGAAFPISSGDAVPKQKPGEHTIVITAYDGAGNKTDSKATFHVEGITPPKILSGPTSLVILKPMTFIGQSSADDTISVFLDGKLIEQFVAKTKQVPKAKSKGTGGFSNGITWEYTYKPQLFPGKYKVHFSRVTSVGAESEPTKDRTITITATAGSGKTAPAVIYAGSLVIALLILAAILFLLDVIFFSAWRYDARLLRRLGHKNSNPAHEALTDAIHWVGSWRPFGWLMNGTLKAQRGFMNLGPIGRRRKSEQPAVTSPDETSSK